MPGNVYILARSHGNLQVKWGYWSERERVLPAIYLGQSQRPSKVEIEGKDRGSIPGLGLKKVYVLPGQFNISARPFCLSVRYDGNEATERLFVLADYHVSQDSTPHMTKDVIHGHIKAQNHWQIPFARLKSIMKSEEFMLAKDAASHYSSALEELSSHIPYPHVTSTASEDPSPPLPPPPLTSEQMITMEALENAIDNYAPAFNAFPVVDNILALFTLYNSVQAYPIFPRSLLEYNPSDDGVGRSGLTPSTIPPRTFAAQRKYQDTSTRLLIIYGRGNYNYGICPNSNQGIYYMSLFLKHIDKQFHQATQQEKEEVLPDTAVIRALWEYYEESAKAAGVARADVGRQFEAEWGINMHHYLPARKSKVPEIQQLIEKWEGKRAEIYKQNLLPIYQTSQALGIGTFPVDSFGEIIWNTEAHGQFVIDVVKIDKATGTECGRL